MFALFATGVIDTSGNLPPVPLTPAANLQPCIADTSGKFASGINNTSDTGRNILPLMSLIPAVHLGL
jgi:hypothetical protein